MINVDRRTFLASAVGIALAARRARSLDAAQGPTRATNPRLIDMHHHFAPPAWVSDLPRRPLLHPPTTPRTPPPPLKDIVTVHPTAADCCRNLTSAPGVGPGSIEYGTDTTRAIMGVAFSGDAVRFPNIRFIWSHAGGSMPFLAGRIDGAANSAKEALP